MYYNQLQMASSISIDPLSAVDGQNIRKLLQENAYFPGCKQTIKIQHYTVYNYLGGGSFADVYRAHDEILKKDVALKIVDFQVLDEKYTNPVMRQRIRAMLETEEALMKEFDHPNLVKCYNSFKNDNFKIFILELCNGGNLDQVIMDCGALREDKAIPILLQMVLGLSVTNRLCLGNAQKAHHSPRPEA